jgi:spore coat protein SA
MIKAAIVSSEESRILHERQGATQINTFEASKRYKRYEPHLFSSSFSCRPNYEISYNIHLHRIDSSAKNKLLFLATHLKPPSQYYIHTVSSMVKKMGIPIVHVRNRPKYMPLFRKFLGRQATLILHEHNQNIADTLSKKEAVNIMDSIDAYVGVSKFTMDFEITNLYSQYANKSFFVRNGVDIQKFTPVWDNKEKAAALRKKHSLDGSVTILFSGAIRERKGIHILVRAMKKVIKKHRNAKLIIAGGSAFNVEPSDPFAKMVKAEAMEPGNNVVFLGFVPSGEMHDIYLLADIFAGPSIWDEPFGLVFAEASACGLPVIATKKGGIPEIVMNNKTGILTDDPTSVDELADKIDFLIEHPDIAKRYGEAGRKNMVDNFSWERVANEIETLYDKLLHDKGTI